MYNSEFVYYIAHISISNSWSVWSTMHALHRCGLLLQMSHKQHGPSARLSHSHSMVYVSLSQCVGHTHTVQKRRNRSRCRLGVNLWVQGTMHEMRFKTPTGSGNFGGCPYCSACIKIINNSLNWSVSP